MKEMNICYKSLITGYWFRSIHNSLDALKECLKSTLWWEYKYFWNQKLARESIDPEKEVIEHIEFKFVWIDNETKKNIYAVMVKRCYIDWVKEMGYVDWMIEWGKYLIEENQ
jgi:hypothetical protein